MIQRGVPCDFVTGNFTSENDLYLSGQSAAQFLMEVCQNCDLTAITASERLLPKIKKFQAILLVKSE
jgi:hypothetical protein